jgi:hypothetical protein
MVKAPVGAGHDVARAHVGVVGRQVEHHLERLEHPARLIRADDAHRHVAAEVWRGLDVERVAKGLRRSEKPIGGVEYPGDRRIRNAVAGYIEESGGFARLGNPRRDLVDAVARVHSEGGNVDERDLGEIRFSHWALPPISSSRVIEVLSGAGFWR